MHFLMGKLKKNFGSNALYSEKTVLNVGGSPLEYYKHVNDNFGLKHFRLYNLSPFWLRSGGYSWSTVKKKNVTNITPRAESYPKM